MKIQAYQSNKTTYLHICKELEIDLEDIEVYFAETKIRAKIIEVFTKIKPIRIYKIDVRLTDGQCLKLVKTLHVFAGLVFDGEKKRKKELRDSKKTETFEKEISFIIPEKITGFTGNLATGEKLVFYTGSNYDQKRRTHPLLDNYGIYN